MANDPQSPAGVDRYMPAFQAEVPGAIPGRGTNLDEEDAPARPVSDEERERVRKHLWQPGQSGNPAGRPKGSKNHLAQLKRELETAVRENINPEAIKSILASVVARAIEGDVKAAKLILDKFITNASEGEEEQKSSGTFVFQVKNLTLKTEEDRHIIDITPQKETSE